MRAVGGRDYRRAHRGHTVSFDLVRAMASNSGLWPGVMTARGRARQPTLNIVANELPLSSPFY